MHNTDDKSKVIGVIASFTYYSSGTGEGCPNKYGCGRGCGFIYGFDFPHDRDRGECCGIPDYGDFKNMVNTKSGDGVSIRK